MKLSLVNRLSCWFVLAVIAIGLGAQLLSPRGSRWDLALGTTVVRLLPLIGACAFALAVDGRSTPTSTPASLPGAVRPAGDRPARPGRQATSAS